MKNKLIALSMLTVLLALVSACSGGGGSKESAHDAPASYYIVGIVSGLSGSGLVLQNNGVDDLAVVSNGTFTFPTKMASGAAYAITVLAQPTALNQTCTPSNNAGTVAGADVTTISIDCITNQYRIGGTVSGLNGSGLVLINNGRDSLPVVSNGTFTFSTALDDGADYAVLVAAQPTGLSQTCSASTNVGKLAGGDIGSVTVICSTNTYAVGGVVSGLTGTGLLLRNNGADDLPIASSGTFTFSAPIADGSGFAIDVKTQPWGQNCIVSSGTGTLAGAPVTTITVACSCLSWWPDVDGDGYGDGSQSPVSECVGSKQGYTLRAGDCNDTDPGINPSAVEVCDRIDNNCDGQIDEGVHFGNVGQTCCAWGTTGQYDACMASYLASGPSFNTALLPCVTAAQSNDPNYWLCYDPGDVCDDVDNNMNGQVDEGQLKCGNPLHCPQAEVCNGQDDNCDGQVDEGGVCGSCVWSLETCDGCDNDCDGVADNKPAEMYQYCLKTDGTIGMRNCLPPQFVLTGGCAAGGGWGACQ